MSAADPVAAKRVPVAVVTGGAGQGIGIGLCTVLAERGWKVWVADLDGAAAAKVARSISETRGAADAVEVDVADQASVSAAVDTILDADGTIVGWVNSAGVGLVKPVAETDPVEFDRVVGTDLRGAWLCCREVVPHMVRAGGGSIVNIGSVHARAAASGYGVYAAAKAGLVALTRAIANDYGQQQLRCNIVHPGLVDGPQTRQLIGQWGDPEQWMAEFIRTRQMLPRSVEARDIGAAVAFLLGDDGRMVTGTELFVDAGTAHLLFDRRG